MMKQYVLGLAFYDDRVVLIRKTHPQWQSGLLNGVGGGIELGETEQMAMNREFIEEAGVDAGVNFWRKVCTMINRKQNWSVHVFMTRLMTLNGIKSMTDEEIGIFRISEIEDYEPISNIKWLIQMCFDINLLGKNLTVEYDAEV